MIIDLHTHSKLCGHGEGTIEEYIVSAIDKGLEQIGISEHLPQYFLPPAQRDLSTAMAAEMLPTYVDSVLRLKEKYQGHIQVLLGIEADFVPGKEEALVQMLGTYPWDYVIGSIHFLKGWGFDDSRQIAGYQLWDINELYGEYFKVLEQAAKSGLFDILGHLDLIKKFGFRPEGSLMPLYNSITDILATYDQCIEINTAGWRYPASEQYPNVNLLALCVQKKIPITLGSDAHSPADVGKDYSLVKEIIKTLGIRELAVFSQRKRMCIRIGS